MLGIALFPAPCASCRNPRSHGKGNTIKKAFLLPWDEVEHSITSSYFPSFGMIFASKKWKSLTSGDLQCLSIWRFWANPLPYRGFMRILLHRSDFKHFLWKYLLIANLAIPLVLNVHVGYMLRLRASCNILVIFTPCLSQKTPAFLWTVLTSYHRGKPLPTVVFVLILSPS